MPQGFQLPIVAFFGRTLAEYLEMFVIELDELRGGTTLDCPSGPDSFVAEARAAGCEVFGCDPMYEWSPDELRRRGRANLEEAVRHVDAQRSRLQFRDFDAFRQAKFDALERFLADYEVHYGEPRYFAANLPTLPFATGSFDRILAANFLFSYAHSSAGGLYTGREYDLDFHLRSVDELARVARSEIRLSPMGSFDPPPRPHAYRDPVRARLESLGWKTDLVPSRYQSGLSDFNDVLVARRSVRTPDAT